MKHLKQERKQLFEYDEDAYLLDRKTVDKLWAETFSAPPEKGSRDVQATAPFMSDSNSSDEDGPPMEPQLRISVIGERYRRFNPSQFIGLQDTFAEQMQLFPSTDFRAFQTLFKEAALRNTTPVARLGDSQIVMKATVKVKPSPYSLLGVFGFASRPWVITHGNWDEVKDTLRDGVTEGIQVSYWIEDRNV